MNLYEVTSEMLEYVEPILEDGSGPTFPYRIWELVAARSHGQAKYLAWKYDGSFDYDIREMPKMSCRLLRKDIQHNEPGLVTDCQWAEDILLERYPIEHHTEIT